MGKYFDIGVIKKIKSRVSHVCDRCEGAIVMGSDYYSKEQKDKFLHSLNRKKICEDCYKEYGESVFNFNRKRSKTIFKNIDENQTRLF